MSDSYFLKKDRWTTRAGEWLLYALAWVVRWVSWPVPTWTLAGIVGPLGGRVALLIPGLRRRAERNIQRVWPAWPEERRRALVRDAGDHFCRLALEYAQLDKMVRELEISVEGIRVLEAAKAKGRGAVLVTAHYGNWEAVRLAAMRADTPTGIIYRPFNNRYLDRFAMNLIPCLGEPVLHKGAGGMRRLLAHVSSGGFIMILVDQRNSGAPYLDFLGAPAETVTVAADLAYRTGAALIPARGIRNVEERRFDVRIEEPVTGDTALEMMQSVNDRISDWVREHPEQWLWFHRRWRSTIRSREHPEG